MPWVVCKAGGAATLLAERRAALPGDVVLMFQPGEEGHDGAGGHGSSPHSAKDPVTVVTAPYNHSPNAVFDDSVLTDGAALYAQLAISRPTSGTAG